MKQIKKISGGQVESNQSIGESDDIDNGWELVIEKNYNTVFNYKDFNVSYNELQKVVFIERKDPSGGKQYTDTTTVMSISEGSTMQLTTSVASTVDINMPSDFTEMWDDTSHKLLAVNNKDYFVTELRFKAESSVANGRMAVHLDIGGALGIILIQTINLNKTADTDEEYSVQLCYFTGTTFIANGGTIKFEAIDGDLTISHPVIIPFRVHRGR